MSLNEPSSVCPGQHLADLSIYLTIATTLSLFEIKNATNKATGLPIVPVPDYKAGLIWYSVQFQIFLHHAHFTH